MANEPVLAEKFAGLYAAYWGNFPMPEAPSELHAWMDFFEQIPDSLLDDLFRRVNDNRKGIAKPRLGAFWAAWRALQADTAGQRDVYRDPKDERAKRQLNTPLFNFALPGFPKRREAYLCELPRSHIEIRDEMWDKYVMHPKMTRSEMLAMNRALFDVTWDDYTDEEKQARCKRWSIDMPKRKNMQEEFAL